MNKPAAFYGTALVLFHLLVNILHGTAHSRLQIGLDLLGQLFVAVVILLGPLLAMALLWTRFQRAGLILLGVSMAASLLFGVYYHFVIASPDEVGRQGSGLWANLFAVTAWLLAITEGLGGYVAVRFLPRKAAG